MAKILTTRAYSPGQYIRQLGTGDFLLGSCRVTPRAHAALERNLTSIEDLLIRHRKGTYGNITMEEYSANRKAYRQGGRVRSIFSVSNDDLWVATEVEPPLGSDYTNSTFICLADEGADYGISAFDSKEDARLEKAYRKAAKLAAKRGCSSPVKFELEHLTSRYGLAEPVVKASRPSRVTLGQCQLTVAASELLERYKASPESLLDAHQTGRPGDLALKEFR